MRKAYLTILVVLTFSLSVKTQVGIGTTTPNAASMLDITSTNKGLLVPRVTLTSNTDITTIPTAPTSLIVFNTTAAGSGTTAVVPGFYYWDGTTWLNFITYTLQQNINTNGKFLSGDGTNNGILLSDNGNMVVKGGFGTGPNLSESGDGAKLIWHPKKAAFRVGFIESTDWDQTLMGENSAAFGHESVASGPGSSAFGSFSIASGSTAFAAGNNAAATNSGSIAFGNGTFASGVGSMAFGEGSTSSGDYAITFGVATLAGGINSMALGFQTNSAGDYSTAMGYQTSTAGFYATSTGYFTTASGNNSTAMGNRVSTDGKEGAFIIGDNSTVTPTNSILPNEMTMRFANGYRLIAESQNTSLTMSADGAVVSKGNFGSGLSLAETGEGSKLIWYPKKSAFRAGYVVLDAWDDANTGENSIGLGYDVVASGTSSAAFGSGSIASGVNSFATGSVAIASGSAAISMGNSTSATGNFSVAFGESTQASGDNSVALGFGSFAFGVNSTAFGNTTTSGGDNSTAMGYHTDAGGHYSTAMGFNTTSSADNSTSMGNFVSTGIHAGSFIIGDNSTVSTTTSTAANQMTMRFANGYQLFSNTGATVGVKLDPGDNAWSIISDVNAKENFAAIDGEEFLSRIGTIPLTTWNYKGQDPGKQRHYGPMAQDFHRAFGTDKYGTIGNNTSINQADFDGVNFTAIQALESRTRKMQEEKQQQELKINDLEKENTSLKDALLKMQHSFDAQQDLMDKRIKELEKAVQKIK
jgi:hypothetical protein